MLKKNNIKKLFSSIGIVCLVLFVYYLRCPRITLVPDLYAEDGNIFLNAAFQDGISALFEPYAGYLHLYQRIVALFAVDFLPIKFFASFFLLSSWFAYAVPLLISEYLINKGMIKKFFRLSYIAYAIYPYAVETYINLPNSYIFFPIGYILLIYGIFYTNDPINSKIVKLSDLFKLKFISKETDHFSFLVNLCFLCYGFVSVLTGPFVFLFVFPLYAVFLFRNGKIWITYIFRKYFIIIFPSFVSLIQIFLSKFYTDYNRSNISVIEEIFLNPHNLLRWASIHLTGPVFGGTNFSSKLQIASTNVCLFYFFIYLVFIVSLLHVFYNRYAKSVFWIIFTLFISVYTLSFSSLFISLQRGSSFADLLVSYAGGRFFFWHTVFIISLLTFSFCNTLINFYNLKFANIFLKLSSIIIILWMLFFVANISADHYRQQALQTFNQKIDLFCLSNQYNLKKGTDYVISIYPGAPWSVNVPYEIISKHCQRITP